jgi:hypothetical protein
MIYLDTAAQEFLFIVSFLDRTAIPENVVDRTV